MVVSERLTDNKKSMTQYWTQGKGSPWYKKAAKRTWQIAKDPMGSKSTKRSSKKQQSMPTFVNRAEASAPSGGSWGNGGTVDEYKSGGANLPIADTRKTGGGGSRTRTSGEGSYSSKSEAKRAYKAGKISWNQYKKIRNQFKGGSSKSSGGGYERQLKTGNQAIDALIEALTQGFERKKELLSEEYQAGTGRVGSQRERAMEALGAQKTKGLEEFGEEKGKDIARLQAFYNAIGTGGSEQAGQGLERMQGQYAKRFGGLEESYGRNVRDVETDYAGAQQSLEMERARALAGYQSQYDTGRAGYEQQRGSLERDLQEYQMKQEEANFNRQLQERSMGLDELRTQYQINKPYSAGGGSGGGAIKTGKYYSRFNPMTQQNEYVYADPVGGESLISEQQFMQGKYGVGIGNLGGGGVGFNQGYGDMTDEELMQIASPAAQAPPYQSTSQPRRWQQSYR